MNRRDLLTTTLAAAGAVMASTAFGSAATTTVAEAAAKCIAVGLKCAAHCEREMANGNKEMATCHASVMETIAACEALQKLAVAESKHLKEFAGVCAKICADCAKTCEVHAKHMEICRLCMDSCKECEKACHAV